MAGSVSPIFTPTLMNMNNCNDFLSDRKIWEGGGGSGRKGTGLAASSCPAKFCAIDEISVSPT